MQLSIIVGSVTAAVVAIVALIGWLIEKMENREEGGASSAPTSRRP